jgi:hypothetical protein
MFSLRNAAQCKAILEVTLFLMVASSTLAETLPDTTHLTDHLNALRGKKALTAEEYRSLQTEYMDWIDARVRAGVSIEIMNAELREADLFYHWIDSADRIADESSQSRAGYLEPISTRPLRGAAELLAVKAAIYKGIGCDLEMTVALYEKDSLKRVGLLEAPGRFRTLVPSFRNRRRPPRRSGRMADRERLDCFKLFLGLERQARSHRRCE